MNQNNPADFYKIIGIMNRYALKLVMRLCKK